MKVQYSFFLKSLSLFVLIVFFYDNVFSQNWGGGKRIPSVKVEKVVEEVISTTKEIRGRVVSSYLSSVSPIVNGNYKIQELKIGDIVSKGQVIATMDNSDLLHRILIQESQLENNNLILQDTIQQIQSEKEILTINKEQLEIFISKTERFKELLKTNAISEQDYENVISSKLSSKQQVKLREKTIGILTYKEKQAKNNRKRLSLEIKKLKKDLEDYKLLATESGQIVYLLPTKKGYIRSGERIADIQNLENFEIEAEIPLEYISNVINSKKILGEDFSGNKITAEYRVVLPFDNPRTGTRTVRFEIKNSIPESLKASDAAVSLQIPTSLPRPVITIPKDALIPIGNGQVAYVFNEEGVIRKSLKLGGSYEDKMIVLEGLNKSDLVVTRGNELLKDGDKVKIADKANTKSKERKIKGEEWVLEWEGRRGTQTGKLILGDKKSFFNEDEVSINKDGKNISFKAPLVLPFGTLELLFEGEFLGETLKGILTISGLPNGQTRENPFSGKKVLSK